LTPDPQGIPAVDLVRLKVIEGLRERSANHRLTSLRAEERLEAQRRAAGPSNKPRRPRRRSLFQVPVQDEVAIVAQAVRDFKAGRLLLYVDGECIVDPESVVPVGPMTRIRLVRLLTLSG
jgi:hypothetical protein